MKERSLAHVVFKGKVLEDRQIVELITTLPDAHYRNQKETKVVASVFTEDNVAFKGKTVLTNNIASLTSDRTAVFQKVKAEISSRMAIVHLHFELRNKADVVLCSTSHDPRVVPCFIVITNESQWCEAQGKLIVQDCFHGSVRQTRSRFLSHLTLSSRLGKSLGSTVPTRFTTISSKPLARTSPTSLDASWLMSGTTCIKSTSTSQP